MESELIYRSEAIKTLLKQPNTPTPSVIRRVLRQVPTVDAVELPVHTQQIVYANLRPWETTLNIQPFMVTCITVAQNKKGDWTKKFRAHWFNCGRTVDVSRNFRFDEIGEKVFFTQEEAEAVLGRGDDGK